MRLTITAVCPFLFLATLGASTADSFQSVTEPVSSPRYQRFVDNLFTRFDKNEDGVIQRKEHENTYFPLLNLADSNDDARVTREEVVDWLQKNTVPTMQGQLLNRMANDVQQEQQLNAEASKVQQPQLDQNIDVTFVALEMPDDFAKQELVSLKDLSKVVGSKKFDKKELVKNGITILQVYEFSTGNLAKCRLGFGYPEQLQSEFYSVRSGGERGFGSTLDVLPEIINDKILIKMDFAAILSNKGNQSMRKLGVETSLVFTKTTPTKLINLYSEGVHYLLIVSANVQ